MIFKKSGPPEWLLVCLGNYGKQYENTRHNIGFMAAERLIDKRDLRCNRLTITEKGAGYTEACRRSFDGVDALAFRGFRDDECEALYNYLQRLTANLETDEFRERSVFSLRDEEKRLHVAMKMQEKEEEDGRD